jgi:hypothetical protein
MFVNPWISKDNLRYFLLKFKEDKELDDYVRMYLQFLDYRIIRSPSKGPYGEQGKDLVAIEDEVRKTYCSYVIKAGTLQENLDGNFGILKQMRDALLIPLEEIEYNDSRRTVVVVHNGYEGYRGAINVFERVKEEIQKQLGGNLLLRKIQRWDIEELTNRFFKKRKDFEKAEEAKLILAILHEHEKINIDFEKKAEVILSDPQVQKTEYKRLLKDHFGAIKKIKGNFALEKFAEEGTYDK